MIREYTPRDYKYLLGIHRRAGLPTPFPDLDDPLFFSKMVVENAGRVEMGFAAKMTAEIFFLADPDAGTPAERWAMLQQLHEAGEQDVIARGGIDEVNCWIPPTIARAFGRRLHTLGWEPETWPAFCKTLVMSRETAEVLVHG